MRSSKKTGVRLAGIIAVAVICAMVLSPVSDAALSTPTGTAIEITGVYSEIHGDAKLSDETFYYIRSSGRYYRLDAAVEPHAHTGDIVRVTGTLRGTIIDVAGPGDLFITAAAAPSGAAVGTMSVLVINVVFPAAALTATLPQEQNFMFGSDTRSVDSFYRATSYGQMNWTGSITPQYTVSDPGTCDLYALSSAAEAAATAGGYTPDNYSAIMINAPMLHCAAVGYGEIGGKHTWIENGLWNLDDGYARLVPTHELGHSLGLFHSHGLECGSDSLTLSCVNDADNHNEEYGNAWDVMGNNWPGDSYDGVAWFSAKQEILLGWLASGRIQTVTGSGTFVVVPLEKTVSAGTQALVIPTPAHTYYVEYRRPLGQDAFMANFPAAINGVHVSVSAGSNSGPFAVDFTPNSDSGYYDWFDAPLAVGGSFTDPEHTFTLTLNSQNGTTASVGISFGTLPGVPVSVAETKNDAARTSTLTWMPPTSDGGSPITGYRVARNGTDSAGNGPWATIVSPTARSQTFSSLRPGSTYTLSVKAITAAGIGPAATRTVTMAAVAPSVPTSVTITKNDTAKTGTITWQPPTSTGGSPITGYRVARDGTDSTGKGPWAATVTATARSQTFSNLKPGSTYTLSVKAINAKGYSPPASGKVTIN